MVIKRKKSMIGCLVLLIIIFISVVAIMNYISKRNKPIILDKSIIRNYIKAADEASEGKLQVNWKLVAAINAVQYKKEFSNIPYSEILNLSKSFLDKNTTQTKVRGSEYRLKTAEEVLNNLKFDKKQKDKFQKYLEELEYEGLARGNLYEGAPNLEFIKEIKEEAINGYDKYGILPSITIGQAILESGWGKSELVLKANNLFGIKADASWKGKKVSMKTSEYYNKVITDSFRAYESKEDSIKDHREFLYKNTRYKQAGVFEARQYIEQAQALQKGGYSTVQNKQGEYIYAELIINIIKENNLQLVDNEAQMRILTNKKQ